MKPSLFIRSLLLLSALYLSESNASAQSAGVGESLRQMPPEYEMRAKELRSAPKQQYDFSKSNLGDVLRFLATDAKLSFISLPEDSAEAGRVVTFSINGSPFSVLETLCKANGLSLIPEESGMWYIRPADDRELVAKSYVVRHNAMERVSSKIDGNGGGGGSIQSSSVDLQGAKDTFKVRRSELINDIRAILDLPPEQEDDNGNVAQGGAGAPGMSAGPLAGLAGGPAGGAEAGAGQAGGGSTTRQPKVIWKSDSNTLYVVATRLQQMWVESYLAATDKEQPLIAMEVKFIETSKDPTKELGIDWSGTLGGTGTFRQADKVSYDPTTGAYTVSQTNVTNSAGGYRMDVSPDPTFHDLNHGLRNPLKGAIPFDSNGVVDKALEAAIAKTGTGFYFPASALLSNQDLSFRLRALLNDQDTKTVAYPRMVTLNNREVVIRSVVNQPVLDGTSSISGGGAASVSSKITYLPIGTVLNILPKKMDGDHILLNIKVTVSSIIGEQVISGNPYPVATSRVYNAPVEVNDGYTVAIGGLDEAKETSKETGVPLLGRIPILGYAFKSKSRAKNHKNLMMFITPMLIDPKGGGLSEDPISVVPQRPNVPQPKKPQVDAAGQLQGGPDAVPETIAYLNRECDKIQATIDENRATDRESKKLTEMKIAVNKLEEQVATMTAQHPDKADILTKASIDVAGLHERVGRMKMLVLKKDYY